MKKKLLMCCLMLSGLFFLNACLDEEKNALVQVWLTDAPGDFQQVNIEIEGIEVNANEGEDESGWKSLWIRKGVYNLLELTNGLDTLLGEIELPEGKISQIRLKLGNDNTVKVNNKVYDLSTPSGQQSGLKLQVHETLDQGITYKILLDFDVARSVIQTGSGQYKLKPVIRTITEAQGGAIKGLIDPAIATPAIYVINGTDTVGTTYSDEAGQFLVRGVPAGTYKVFFSPNIAFKPFEKTNVNVATGEVTDLGVVSIAH